MGTVRWLKYKIETLPIPKLPLEEQIPFVELVNSILGCKKNFKNTDHLEAQLDHNIYDLFSFNNEEIAVIEQW